jgi:lipopolysaccharide/colanic/teichoic acid biosynthesis glycosyltransferase
MRKKARMMRSFLRDPEKKGVLQISCDLDRYALREKEIPVHYFTRLLYRKESSNYLDFLDNKRVQALRARIYDPRVNECLQMGLVRPHPFPSHWPFVKSVKRFLDVVLSVTGLAALAPVLLLLAIAVRVIMGSPVFFKQVRPGLYGRPFRMLKFRTMRDAVDAAGRELPDSARLTRMGRFLRSTSLDELPELLNVVSGHMSLVGPRPLLMKYLPYYTAHEMRRHEVRPGITGWAQVAGRNMIGWNERLALDVWYVENRSFRLDIKIMLLTIRALMRRDGVVVDPRSRMRDLDEERKASAPADTQCS